MPVLRPKNGFEQKNLTKLGQHSNLSVSWLKETLDFCRKVLYIKRLRMSEQGQKIPPPILLSVIICDQVITDLITRKNTLVGVFDNINAIQFPARHAWLAIFCQLTNGRGRVPITVRLVDVGDSDTVLGEFKVEESFKDPREVRNLRLDIGGTVFPHEGEYRFQIYADEEFLGERRIICRKVEIQKEEQK